MIENLILKIVFFGSLENYDNSMSINPDEADKALVKKLIIFNAVSNYIRSFFYYFRIRGRI